MKSTPVEIRRYLRLLEEISRRIAACAIAPGCAPLKERPSTTGWSAVEILAHIRACEEVWSHSIFTMLTEECPELPQLDPRRWARVARYTELEFQPSFQVFAMRRSELLHVLSGLASEAWERCAVIAGRRHTVFTQVRRIGHHEAKHLEQIEALFGKA
jgi:hypothetical protein